MKTGIAARKSIALMKHLIEVVLADADRYEGLHIFKLSIAIKRGLVQTSETV
jgi:hypothetical protein